MQKWHPFKQNSLIIPLDSDLLSKRAIEIEKKLFSEYNQEVNQDYKNKVRSLVLNLKSKINPGLKEGVVTGEISIHQLCTMSVEASQK
jgi:transcription elongation factor S-II